MSRFPVFALVLLLALVSTLVQGKLLDDVNAIGAQSNKPTDNSKSGGGVTGLLVGDGIGGSVNAIGAQEDQAETTVERTKTPYGTFEKVTENSGSPVHTLIDGITG